MLLDYSGNVVLLMISNVYLPFFRICFIGECRENQQHDTQYQAAIYLAMNVGKAIESVDDFMCLGIDITTNHN